MPTARVTPLHYAQEYRIRVTNIGGVHEHARRSVVRLGWHAYPHRASASHCPQMPLPRGIVSRPHRWHIISAINSSKPGRCSVSGELPGVAGVGRVAGGGSLRVLAAAPTMRASVGRGEGSHCLSRPLATPGPWQPLAAKSSRPTNLQIVSRLPFLLSRADSQPFAANIDPNRPPAHVPATPAHKHTRGAVFHPPAVASYKVNCHK